MYLTAAAPTSIFFTDVRVVWAQVPVRGSGALLLDESRTSGTRMKASYKD